MILPPCRWHDPLHDREAEPGARLGEGLGVGGPEELAEQLVLVIGGDADALVGAGEHHPVTHPVQRDRDGAPGSGCT